METNNTTEKPQESYEVTKKDVRKAWYRWFFSNAISHSFDRYLGPALLWALLPMLKKLYPDEDERRAAYERHAMFFNTQVSWGGGTILGIVSSIENKRAQVAIDDEKQEEKSELSDLIVNTKAGLMGALAGVGDSIDSGTILYIFIAICLPWAQRGMFIGALLPFLLMTFYQLISGLYFSYLGFSLGRSAASELVGSRRMKGIIEALSVLGLFMMGVLGASYVDVESALTFTISGKEFVAQDILDQVLPGLLPLTVIGGIYFYFLNKGMNVTRALLGLTVILGVLAAIGIL